MANMATQPEGNPNDGVNTLTGLYNLISGNKTSGGGSTVTNSGGTEWGGSSSFQDAYTDTQTETSHIDEAGLNAMLKSILEGTSGLAAVSSGQRSAGGYNSSVNSLLTNDLLARAAGQVAMNNKTTTTVRNVGARTSNTVSMREIPSTTTTTVKDDTQVGGNKGLGYLMGGLSAYSQIKKLKLLDGFGQDKTSYDAKSTAGDYRNEMDKASDAYDNSNSNSFSAEAGPTATEMSVDTGFNPMSQLGGAESGWDNFSVADNVSFDNIDWGVDGWAGGNNLDWTGDFGDYDYGNLLSGGDLGGLGDLGFNLDEVDWGGLGNFSFADGGLVGKSALKQHFQKSVPKRLADGGLVGGEDEAFRPKRQNNMLASQANTILDPRSGANGGAVGFNEANMGQYNPVTRTPISKNPVLSASNTGRGARVGLTREQINEIIEARSAESAKLGKEGNDNTDAQGNISSNPSATAASVGLNMGLSVLGLAVPGFAPVAALGKSLMSIPDVQQFVLEALGLTPSAAQSFAIDNPTSESATLAPLGEPEGIVTVGELTEDEAQQDMDDALSNPVTESEGGEGPSSDDGGTNGVAGDANAGDGGDGSPGDGSGTGGGNANAADGGLIASLMSEAPTAGVVKGAGSTVGDKVDAKLSPDEYVLPADVVEALGVDKLDAIVKRYHTPAVVQKAQMRKGK